MVCLACAMDVEYENVKKYFKVQKENIITGKYRAAECEGGRLLIVKSGVGSCAAYDCMMKTFEHFQYISAVFSTGMAGALAPDLVVSDIVAGSCVIDCKDVTNVNMLCSDINLSQYFYNADNLRKGRIVSCNSMLADKEWKEDLYQRWQGICVEMESAGVIKLCLEKKVPFGGIKVISDMAEGHAVVSMLRAMSGVTEVLGSFLKKQLLL